MKGITFLALVLFLAAHAAAPAQSVTILEYPVKGSPPSERAIVHPAGPVDHRTATRAVSSPASALFTVTDPSDAPADSVPVFDPPTLRAAIQCANAIPGRDAIVVLTVQDTIYLTSSLPPILDPVDFDGKGKAISGALLVANAFGISLHTGNSHLRDLAIVDFTKNVPGSSIGISLQGNADTIRGVKIHNIAGPGINLNFATNCLIGGTGIYFRNQITGCTGTGGTGIGILANSAFNTVENNFIGNDGSTAIGNSRYGVNLRGEGNRILRNVISGNEYGGVNLNATFADTARRTLIEGNRIGLNDIGDTPIGTQADGVSLSGGVEDTIRGNVICNNQIGVDATSLARGTVVEGNLIGINRFDEMIGHTAGIRTGGSDFRILGNLISGNSTGISISDEGGALVRGNRIGTDSTGGQARPNGAGIYIAFTARASVIGGPLAEHRNLVSGNSGIGIQVSNADSVLIEGNYIGTDATGSSDLGNGEGVLLRLNSHGNRISGNLISGNDATAIRIAGLNGAWPSGNVVTVNYIGIAANGDDPLPNASHGILVLDGRNNSIGDTGLAGRNYIAGNGGHGISVGGDSAAGNLIVNNSIGAGVSGVPAGNLDGIVLAGRTAGTSILDNDVVNNLFDGIRIADLARGNLVRDNLVAGNGGNGVSVLGTAASSELLHNSIDGNGLLGIDLGGDGVSGVDDGDDDDGPNGLQNRPDLLVVVADTGVTAHAELRSSPLAEFHVDWYDSDSCDPGGFGEGKTYIGSRAVTTDSAGRALFSQSFPAGTVSGVVTATVTDSAGNTSEFSNCEAVSPPGLFADLVVTVDDGADSVVAGDTLAWALTVENRGPDTLFGVVVSDTLSGSLTLLADSLDIPFAAAADTVLTYLLPVMGPGASTTFTIRGRVEGSGTVAHRAAGTGSGATDYRPTNNVDSDSTAAGPATGVEPDQGGTIPRTYSIAQNYPNPFNPSTSIFYTVPGESRVELGVYNMLGELVMKLVDRVMPGGTHTARWEPGSLPAGVYFCRFVATDAGDPSRAVRLTRKMLYIK